MFSRRRLVEWMLGIASILGLVVLGVMFLSHESPPNVLYTHPLDNMRVIEGPIYNTGLNAPHEDRGIEYRRFLAPSLKIKVSGASGSGTICYYDSVKNEAWVISCGHLWSGNMTAEQGKIRRTKAKVVTWYHNLEKLPSPKEYPADVLFYSNSSGYDISLLKFTPDWKPEYFPIAQPDYPLAIGQLHHSVGCDGGREVARYEVEIISVGKSSGRDTRIRRNSPRPGRSGGGLLTEDGYYIGICWGTTDVTSGNGEGIFTSIPSIRSHFTKEGYSWILNKSLPNMAQNIPIIDREDPNRTFPGTHIPLPEFLEFMFN